MLTFMELRTNAPRKLNTARFPKHHSFNDLLPRKGMEIISKLELSDRVHSFKDIKYYLHLPQIAYTLDRLPKNVLDDDDFRKALKNPYNSPYYRAIATWIELLNR